MTFIIPGSICWSGTPAPLNPPNMIGFKLSHTHCLLWHLLIKIFYMTQHYCMIGIDINIVLLLVSKSYTSLTWTARYLLYLQHILAFLTQTLPISTFGVGINICIEQNPSPGTCLSAMYYWFRSTVQTTTIRGNQCHHATGCWGKYQ